MNVATTILLAVLLFSFRSPAAAQDEPEALTSLRSRFQEELSKDDGSVNRLNDGYLQALQRLSAEESQSGNLDRVLEVKKESEAFGMGKSFEREAFTQRLSENRKLRALQTTYLDSREKIDEAQANARSKVIAIYQKQLEALEASLTREQKISHAVMVRKERDSIANLTAGDAPEVISPPSSLRARLYLVAKGEVTVFVNGKKLRLEDEDDDLQYFVATSAEQAFVVGDVVAIRMRGDAVFRGASAGLKATDGEWETPFPASVYRLIGSGNNVDPTSVTPEKFLADSSKPVTKSPTDTKMVGKWREFQIDGSDFVQSPEKGDWAVFGVTITDAMIPSDSQ